MKNCRKKIRGVVNGSIWDDDEFGQRLRKLTGKKSAQENLPEEGLEVDENYVVTNADIEHAVKVLADFMEMEKGFCSVINDDNNWEIVGQDEWTGKVKSLPFVRTEDMGCC
jgi:hypothetical protein